MSNSQRLRKSRMVALFILGVVLFNYPILSLFNHKLLILGIPVLYLFMFSVWLLFIVLIIYITASRNKAHQVE